MNAYGLHEKADQKHSGKHILEEISTKVSINFAGMLLVACKQHIMLFLETLKSYDDSAVVISK